MADILTPDLCIIGGGTAGLRAAAAARHYGASVVLVERGRVGGSALNAAALPSKALLAAAGHAQALREAGRFGITPGEPRVNWRRLHEHLRQVVEAAAPDSAPARLEALGITLLPARGRFTDARTIAAGDTRVQARRFVIATGARPLVPAIPGLEAVPYFTTETIFDNTRKLTHLVVIGGGPLGAELAQACRRLGAEVTLVEAETPLPLVDPELAAVALRRLEEEGVALRAGTSVVAIEARSQGIGVVIAGPDGETTLDASHILVATGRAPDLEGLDLELAGIRRLPGTPHRLALRPGLRTSNRRVYAIGDAAGGPGGDLAAARQAELVVRRALFGPLFRGPATTLPRIAFTDPEIVEIGLNEAAARRRHGAGLRVLRASYAENDRAVAMRQTFGLAKLLADRRGRILGVGLVGPGAAELAALFALALEAGIDLRQLRDLALPYPTLAEIANRLGDAFAADNAGPPLARRALALFRRLP